MATSGPWAALCWEEGSWRRCSAPWHGLRKAGGRRGGAGDACGASRAVPGRSRFSSSCESRGDTAMVKLKVLPCHGHSSIRAWLFVFWINFVYLSAILLKEKCILVCFFFFFFNIFFFLQLWMLFSKSRVSVLIQYWILTSFDFNHLGTKFPLWL